MSVAAGILAGTLGAGFLNTIGTMYTNGVNSATQLKINDENRALQYQINADQIAAAQMNNETAINLANTAHQREVMDLRDANLNPILSANGNGSAVPSLDTPGLEAPQAVAPTMQNPLAGLASSLASAVQVNDAHNLNEARLSALGLSGDSEQKASVSSAFRQKALSEAVSAREMAELELQRASNERQLEALKTHVLYDTVGEDGLVDPRKPAYKLMREGFLSDLKMKANANFRKGISTATDVAGAVGDLLPYAIKKSGRR